MRHHNNRLYHLDYQYHELPTTRLLQPVFPNPDPPAAVYPADDCYLDHRNADDRLAEPVFQKPDFRMQYFFAQAIFWLRRV